MDEVVVDQLLDRLDKLEEQMIEIVSALGMISIIINKLEKNNEIIKTHLNEAGIFGFE